MLVKECMSKPVITLTPKDTVNAFVRLMEKYNIHEVPITSRGKVLGVVHYKELAARGIIDPTKAKLEKFIIKSPMLSGDATLDEAAEILFKKGFRAVPVVEKDKLVGIFSVFDLMKNIKVKEMNRITAEEIMSTAEVIKETDDIGKARVIMREKNISRLPVVDDYGGLVGIVSVLDLLKAIKPRERISWYSMAAEKLTNMKISVSTIMNKNPLTARKTDTLQSLIKKMSRAGESGVVIVEKSGPVGVVTTRDILEFYLSLKATQGVYVQITGLEKQNREVDKMLSETIKKISRFYPIQYAYLHVKRYRRTGRNKYSIRCRLMTGKGMFTSKAMAWSLAEAVGSALDNLERAVLKNKLRLSDKLKHRLMSLKRMRI